MFNSKIKWLCPGCDREYENEKALCEHLECKLMPKHRIKEIIDDLKMENKMAFTEKSIYECDECGQQYDKYGIMDEPEECSVCSGCEECCECVECSGCGKKVDVDIGICDCGCCAECCDCSEEIEDEEDEDEEDENPVRND